MSDFDEAKSGALLDCGSLEGSEVFFNCVRLINDLSYAFVIPPLSAGFIASYFKAKPNEMMNLSVDYHIMPILTSPAVKLQVFKPSRYERMELLDEWVNYYKLVDCNAFFKPLELHVKLDCANNHSMNFMTCLDSLSASLGFNYARDNDVVSVDHLDNCARRIESSADVVFFTDKSMVNFLISKYDNFWALLRDYLIK